MVPRERVRETCRENTILFSARYQRYFPRSTGALVGFWKIHRDFLTNVMKRWILKNTDFPEKKEAEMTDGVERQYVVGWLKVQASL